MKIGGNIMAEILEFTEKDNQIGEVCKVWKTVKSVRGFLDLSKGQCDYEEYNSKLQQSTHVFICDFFPLDKSISAEMCCMKIADKIYDIMLIDNPLELNQQYEIYLKYVGGESDI